MKSRVLPWLFCLAVLLPALVGVAMVLERGYDVPLSHAAIRFERPWAGLLAVGALLVVWSRGYWDKLRAPRLQVSRGLDLAALPVGWRVRLRPLLYALRFATILLCVLGLMGPQSIHAREKNELEGIDIVLTLDLSLSMQAQDIAPNRFEATKYVVDDFVSKRPNDRIGAVVFGRDAYTLMPLTSDKDMLRTAISELQLGMIEGRGTAIGNAVGVSLNRLRTSRAKSRALIVLTDGDSNSGNVAPDEAADFAKNMGVKLYTVLMGRPEEAQQQQGVIDRMMGNGGQNFPINPELLKRMAQATGGEFYLATDRRGLERSFHAILDALEKSEIEDAGAIYGELFPAFLGPAAILLLIEALLGTLVFRRWP
ncbi:MAG: VWA domain-containing protein [Polyangiales bacterium]